MGLGVEVLVDDQVVNQAAEAEAQALLYGVSIMPQICLQL